MQSPLSLSKQQATNIALHLCRATQILDENCKMDFEIPLKTRVGSGNSTYCKWRKKEGKMIELYINYGIKMIQSKYLGNLWRTVTEIHERGYFQGEITFVNLMASVVLHEYAHAIQFNTSKFTKNSIHNRHFYKILDLLHQSVEFVKVVDYLKSVIDFELPTKSFEKIQTYKHNHVNEIVCSFGVGDNISFVHKGIRHFGKVTKINRKTLSVNANNLNWTIHKLEPTLTKTKGIKLQITND